MIYLIFSSCILICLVWTLVLLNYGTINVSLSHILVITNHSSEYLSSFSFLFRIRLLSTRHATSIIKQLFVFFAITTISGLLYSICVSTWLQTSHRIFTMSFLMTDPTLCSYHLSHTFTPYFLNKAQWMFKHNLSCLLLYSFCANILLSLTVCRIFSTCVLHDLHLIETSFRQIFLTELVFKACFCAAENKLSVSNFNFSVCTMIFLILYCLYLFPKLTMQFYTSQLVHFFWFCSVLVVFFTFNFIFS